MRTAAPHLLVIFAISLLTSKIANAEIVWESDLRTAHAKASADGKLLLMHFYSDNCIWCERLEAGVFQQPTVGQAISSDFVALKVHANKNPKLASMFKVTKFPTDVVVTVEGQTLTHRVSPQKSDRYVAMLSDCVASQPIAQVAEKLVPTDLPAKPNQRSAARPQTDPVLPASPNNELTVNPGTRSSGGVQAQLTGTRNPNLTPGLAAQNEPFNQLPAGIAAESHSRLGNPVRAIPATPPQTQNNDPISAPTAIAKPALAMQGFCSVSVINENKWVEGKPEFGVIHLGKLYLFSSQQAMGAFLADPVPFTPVLNEIDVVRFFEERKIVQGKREFGVLDPVHNRMFFFSDEAALKHFESEYERYTDAALEVMETAIKEANPGT